MTNSNSINLFYSVNATGLRSLPEVRFSPKAAELPRRRDAPQRNDGMGHNGHSPSIPADGSAREPKSLRANTDWPRLTESLENRYDLLEISGSAG
jgi:hypothetical protein